MKIGIIGGSGLDDPKLLRDHEEIEVETPYGLPSSKITCGKISNAEVYILARHGKKHEIPPTQVNNRANIHALFSLGCTHILATSAVGSLKEEIGKGDFVVLDQFIDFTRRRNLTFFESFSDGQKHTTMSSPFSEALREKIIFCCEELGIRFHPKGTVVTVEGPRFGTVAESKMFRMWGADVVNMSIAPEAILANELGLKYAAVAMSTDYDCWKQDEKAVTWEDVLRTFNSNAEKMKELLVKTIEKISNNDEDFIKSRIRTIPNWPKQGIMFRDITTLLKDSEGFRKTIDVLEERYKNKNIDVIAGIESRGFVLGAALASRLNKSLVLIRKPGKLPADTIREEYYLEYGKDALEIHRDAIGLNERVLVVDDLLATGGTAAAAATLVEKLGGKVVECAFVVELPELRGRAKLRWPIFSITRFEGE
jgi:5'-methylthioadenosine phosphorylase